MLSGHSSDLFDIIAHQTAVISDLKKSKQADSKESEDGKQESVPQMSIATAAEKF